MDGFPDKVMNVAGGSWGDGRSSVRTRASEEAVARDSQALVRTHDGEMALSEGRTLFVRHDAVPGSAGAGLDPVRCAPPQVSA